jgi:hypothetical protein
MAPFRQSVPLRAVSDHLMLADGTMCRMPSPLPGPLRYEPQRALFDFKSTDENPPGNLLAHAAGQIAQSSGSTSNISSPAPQHTEKVA